MKAKINLICLLKALSIFVFTGCKDGYDELDFTTYYWH
jgi:hypothetical protein